MDPTTYRPPPIATQLPLFLVEFPQEESQWVRLAEGSRVPIAGVPWRRSRPSYPELRGHVDSGGNGGVVPASGEWRDGLRLAVLDCDRGDAGALTAAYPPVALARTRRGSHAWYVASDLPAFNGKWSGPGSTGGDFRGGRGYAMLHGDELAAVDAGLSRLARGVGDLPINLLHIDGPRRAEPAARRVLVHVAQAFTRFEAALSRATAHAIKGVVVGGRHSALVRAMARWGGRRTWNGRPLDDEFLALRCACYWLGMPDRRTFGEAEASGILGWVLGARPRWLARPHSQRFLDVQSARAKRQTGKARVDSLFHALSNEAARPWEAEGVSRAWWYRKRQRARP